MHVDKAERLIRTELRKKFGPGYRRKFEIRTCENNHAVSVHWHGEPDEPVIEAIGAPLVTGPAGEDLGVGRKWPAPFHLMEKFDEVEHEARWRGRCLRRHRHHR